MTPILEDVGVEFAGPPEIFEEPQAIFHFLGKASLSMPFNVTGQPRPGFIRLNTSDKMHFIHQDNSPYYPFGYDLAWRHMGNPPMPPRT